MKRLKNIFEKQTLIRISRNLASFALGIIAGVLVVRLPQFEFDWKVSVVNVLTILLTIVFSFMLQTTLSSRASDDRIEKDLIIEQTQRVAKRLEKVGDLCRESALGAVSKSEARLVLGDFKALNGELHTLENLLQLTPIKLEVSRYREIQGACLILKKAVTGAKFPASPLSSEENSIIQNQIGEIRAKVYRLMFYINRL